MNYIFETSEKQIVTSLPGCSVILNFIIVLKCSASGVACLGDQRRAKRHGAAGKGGVMRNTALPKGGAEIGSASRAGQEAPLFSVA